MARKRLLTWRKADGRFMKIVEGRAYYFGRGKSIDDSGAYHQAEEKYLQFMADRQRHAPVAIQASVATVSQVGELYLQNLEDRCERGEVSVSYFVRARTSINEVVAALGTDRRFVAISELDLEAYKSRTLRHPKSPMTGRPISPATAKHRLDAVKALFRWSYKNRLIDEQPRNLLDYTSLSLPPPVVQVFTPDEIGRLWAAASSRTRAFIALGLNAGFGQSDISELRVKEVDLAAGHIIRKRTKTGVPSRHKLWPATMGLLAKHGPSCMSPDGRWFVADGGGPLVWARLDDGKFRKADAIKNAFWRLLREVGIVGGRGFYTLRKTAASEIERIDPLVTSMFLAHSVRDMKRHYALRNWDALDLAIVELGRRFALPTDDGASGVVASPSSAPASAA